MILLRRTEIDDWRRGSEFSVHQSEPRLERKRFASLIYSSGPPACAFRMGYARIKFLTDSLCVEATNCGKQFEPEDSQLTSDRISIIGIRVDRARMRDTELGQAQRWLKQYAEVTVKTTTRLSVRMMQPWSA